MKKLLLQIHTYIHTTRFYRNLKYEFEKALINTQISVVAMIFLLKYKLYKKVS